MNQINPAASDIVAKLWNLCNLLRDDGVTYHQYVSELTYLLFLRMMQETGQEDGLVIYKAPKKGEPVEQMDGTRWADLMAASAPERLDLYKELLLDYGLHGRGAVQQIYANASTFITKPATLSRLVVEIDKLDWYSVQRDDLGDLYEGLLERNANEKKSGAGQYFTPRDLIDSIVTVMQPTLDDVIQDPAAGTGGFLIAANNYLRAKFKPEDRTEAQQRKYRTSTFYGMELVQDTHRLALMNMLLHGIEGGIQFGDTLGEEGTQPARRHAHPEQPAFWHQKRRRPAHPQRLHLPHDATSSSAFCSTSTATSNPAAAPPWCCPTTCCSRATSAADIRRDLMDKCNLHTILRLPTGIFYAQGVKTNVLFFTRGKTDKGNTKEVWVYDMRANMPQFGKRTPFTRDYFRTAADAAPTVPRDKFEDVFGADPCGGPAALARRVDTGEAGRWRKFTRDQIKARGDNLDISWLKDDNAESAQAQRDEPALVARLVMRELTSAMADLRSLLEELGEDPDAVLEDLLIDEEDSDAGVSV